MSAIFVWVYKDHAKLFHLKPKSIYVENVRGHGANHHPNLAETEPFFRHLTEVLSQKESTQVLLMGPSFGAKHFFRHLENHHSELAAKVIGIERVDQMPDSEILSMGRQFLHHYFLNQGLAK